MLLLEGTQGSVGMASFDEMRNFYVVIAIAQRVVMFCLGHDHKIFAGA